MADQEIITDAPAPDWLPETMIKVEETLGPWRRKTGWKGDERWVRDVRLEDGRECMLYTNGVLHTGGHAGLIANSPKYLYDSESSKQMRELKRQRAEDAAIDGMVRALAKKRPDLLRSGADETEKALMAWSEMVASRAEIAMDAERGRDGTDAARWVGAVSGMTGGEKGESGGGDGTIELHATGEKALAVLKILQEKQEELYDE